MSEKPNVLCVSIDSLRADYTSFVTGEESTTPFLNSFAEDSTVYADAISPSIWTLPVHTSVFTGLYPFEHMVLDKNAILGSHLTFAEILGNDGYETASFTQNGWFDIGNITRGFKSESVSDETRSAVEQIRHLIGESLETVSPDLRQRIRRIFDETAREVHRSTFRRARDDPKTVENVAEAIEKADNNFCYFVHLNGVHWPYTPPVTDYKRFSDRSSLELFWHRLYWERKIYYNREQSWIGSLSLPTEQIEMITNLYKACVYATDQLIEQLVETLRKHDRLQNTIVIIFADHGDSFGEQGIYGHHFSLDDSLIHVPLLVYDPTNNLPGGRVLNPVQLNDLYPTILDLCGQEIPETNSLSLAGPESRTYAFTHYEYTDQLATDSIAAFETIDHSKLPPRKQLCIREHADSKLVWYPEEDRYDGPSAGDETLYLALDEHLDGLDKINSDRDRQVGTDVIQKLKDMGYM